MARLNDYTASSSSRKRKGNVRNFDRVKIKGDHGFVKELKLGGTKYAILKIGGQNRKSVKLGRQKCKSVKLGRQKCI
ncbi:hypothetical protein MTR_8g012300 [Medicago truncatula]|uniref:Uncharacterized protein n=1 Tax=Medicago truncatula TaxID=3880 RepID=G7LF57_MEDTR|nr:hypothetical protein MTR_8g012300 [Medicago truncatula]